MQYLCPTSPESMARSFGRIVIYGAGAVGRAVLQVAVDHGFSVLGFLDKGAKPGDTERGLPVWSPTSTDAARAVQDPDALVVVAVFNCAAALDEIHDALEGAGAHRVMSFFSFYELFRRELGKRFWIAPKSLVAAHEHQLAWLRSRLADAKSVAILDALAQQRRTGSMSFPAPDPFEEQYMPRDIEAFSSAAVYAHVVDCGAFDGDTLALFAGRLGEVPMASCFEPDAANYAKLARRVRTELAGQVRAASLWPCGVWDHTTQLRFESGLGSGSRVSDTGGSVIQTVSVDEALVGSSPPTFIKMDIEGAELQALLGARQTIQAHRPALAICLYHEPGHLWQIPRLLDGWDSHYGFYLRLYAHQGFDLVLYAVAPEGRPRHETN